jgi:uncharacterized spore protein YtfJ
MNATEMLEKIGDSIGSKATVKSVFGEPIHAEGRTIVPIAKIAFGFGAGGGQGKHIASESNSAEPRGGGGGGGGLRAYPAGVLEITPTGTRFVPYPDLRMLSCVFIAGAVVGRLLLRRRH